MQDESIANAACTELQQALWAWKGHCVEGASAIGARDTEGVERALAARDALQPRIEELVGDIRRSGTASREAFAGFQRLHQEAAAADRRLVNLLTTERTRLKRDIDGLGRQSAPAAAYRRPDEPNPHRLDIVR